MRRTAPEVQRRFVGLLLSIRTATDLALLSPSWVRLTAHSRHGRKTHASPAADEFDDPPGQLWQRQEDDGERSMRHLAITQNITLDGSIEFLDDWFDPQARGLGDMADLQQEVQRQSTAADGFLTGRRTFEDLRSYWRHREDDTTGASEYLDNVAKYVVSATLTAPDRENTRILSGDSLGRCVR